MLYQPAPPSGRMAAMTSNTTPIKFGTDGWRALIARDFTFASVRACAEGVCRLLREQGLADRGLVVGYDTRFGSPEFAADVAQAAAGNGVKVYLCNQVTPTPVVSFNVLDHKAGGAVVITASHNPGLWNGFKYKPEYAGSASPEIVERLEQHIADVLREGSDNAISLDAARQKGLLEKIEPAPSYLQNLGSIMDLDAIRNAGLRVAVDSMHGAGAGYISSLLNGGSTTVTDLRAERNPLFPGMDQPEPITQNLLPTAEAMRQGSFDVAIATDGDADRLGVLDEHGAFITTLQTFSLLCLHQLEVRGERGPLVKSLTQSGMVDRLGSLYEVPVHTTQVGFKYLGPVMMEVDALAAGEESGGYAFRGNIPERDGILSGLLFLELMVQTGKRPSELVEWIYEKTGPFHYDRWDVPLDPERPATLKGMLDQAPPETLAGLPVLRRDTLEGVYHALEGGYWGLVRFSGTEPLVRLYAEADSPERVQSVLGDMRGMLGL